MNYGRSFYENIRDTVEQQGFTVVNFENDHIAIDRSYGLIAPYIYSINDDGRLQAGTWNEVMNAILRLKERNLGTNPIINHDINKKWTYDELDEFVDDYKRGITNKFKVIDYVDRIIPTNGFIDNDKDTDTQFYTGYRVFIRDNLDEYNSIEEYHEDNQGFSDRNRYEGYGSTTEYVFQEFPRGSSVIVDAGLRNWDMGLMEKNQLISPVSRAIESSNLYQLVDYGSNWLSMVVNLHRRRMGLSEISYDPFDLVDIQSLIDTTSRTALLEQQRVKINLEETKSSNNMY